MALKAIVENLDGMAEAIAAEYTQVDGKFHLQVTEVDGYALEDVSGIRKVLDEVKAERKELRKTNDEFEGEAGSLKRKIAELTASQGTKSKEAIEKLKVDLQELHAGELGKVTTERDSLLGELTEAKLTQKATLALTEAGFTSNGISLMLKTEVPRQAQLVKGDDGYTVSVVNDKGLERSGVAGGSMSLAELAAELKGLYPELVQGSQQNGPGVPGGSAQGGPGKPSVTEAEYKAMEPMQQNDHMAAGGVVT